MIDWALLDVLLGEYRFVKDWRRSLKPHEARVLLAALEELVTDNCVCAETSMRNCPVHAPADPPAGRAAAEETHHG